ncbi:MAG: hypothetical protein LRZ84_10535 [Desertifilum sp.]|nr:hypothetical protein [Desertifilum sp.]
MTFANRQGTPLPIPRHAKLVLSGNWYQSGSVCNRPIALEVSATVRCSTTALSNREVLLLAAKDARSSRRVCRRRESVTDDPIGRLPLQ